MFGAFDAINSGHLNFETVSTQKHQRIESDVLRGHNDTAFRGEMGQIGVNFGDVEQAWMMLKISFLRHEC